MTNRSRYITYMIAVAFAAGSLSSCKKWLAVDPQTVVKEEKQFANQQGFAEALTGAYMKIGTDSLYGRHTSFGTLDVLAQYYENKTSTNNVYGQTARYNYLNEGLNATENTRANINNIWAGMYNAIALSNYILQNVDNGAIKGNAYNIIKGEAIGLRAFLHFDLLRMFAPAYLDGANAGKPAIPFLDQFTVVPQQKKTVGEIINRCEAELLQAQQLLSVHTEIDQIAANQGSTSLDLFLMYRQNHLNYWAVKATLARLYLYKGDKAKALQFAKEVIDSKKFGFVTTAELNTDPTHINSDLTFTKEHIFSIYVSGLKTNADNYFKQTGISVEVADLFSTRAKLDALYETTVTGYGSDYRRVDLGRLWTQVTTAVVYSKKYLVENLTNVKQRLVPNLRLSEMYLIAAEAAPSSTEGVGYLNTLRAARLLPALDAAITPANLDNEIMKEFRKEMYGEGQAFFFYKRRNTLNIPDGVGNPMSEAKYVFPFPLAEIQFGK
ncbi:RagB/SusD family nutrient uptake outer membrane protein [Paraflavitalea sp. CAU 1676]|uniref:RagB/SusD family nutrient uptake outer membrane protein n=1 Tax=Paraflavitalea sp. CAU 1676 TaxID=3032598 RepID=UPI0023DB373B|nr:RagB/SusD family nutrient uptake outer membrane protein [Paraflavitalea sp. CAU 1676]MDF2191407.1 RagB/SusD family nutrient uptake outer membrane protein [Paraflavitalea sp. CAU 1676]